MARVKHFYEKLGIYFALKSSSIWSLVRVYVYVAAEKHVNYAQTYECVMWKSQHSTQSVWRYFKWVIFYFFFPLVLANVEAFVHRPTHKQKPLQRFCVCLSARWFSLNPVKPVKWVNCHQAFLSWYTLLIITFKSPHSAPISPWQQLAAYFPYSVRIFYVHVTFMCICRHYSVSLKCSHSFLACQVSHL